jgi:hypothetical protein
MKITNINNNNYDKGALQQKNTSEKPPADQADSVHINGEITVKELLESEALKNLIANLSGKLKPGDKYVISSGGKEILAAENKAPTIGQKIKESGDAVGTVLAKTIKAPVIEFSNVIKEDKSSAFKLAVAIAKEQPILAAPASLAPMVDNILHPVIRGVGTVIDGVKVYRTFKNKNAEVSDKIIDGIHLATDLVGLSGIVLGWVSGGTLATVLNAVGYAGDFAALGYHGMRYFEKKGDSEPGVNSQGGITPPTPVKPLGEENPGTPGKIDI